jgi:predicted transcriptional regulator
MEVSCDMPQEVESQSAKTKGKSMFRTRGTIGRPKKGKQTEDFIFNEAGAVGMLLYIDEKKTIIQKDLFDNTTGGYAQKRRIIDVFEKREWITSEYQISPFRKYVFTITPKGRKIARGLRRLEEEIGSEGGK